MRSETKQINYRKDGTIKSIYLDVNDKPYKDYYFYKNGNIKKEYIYSTRLTINFKGCPHCTVENFL